MAALLLASVLLVFFSAGLVIYGKKLWNRGEDIFVARMTNSPHPPFKEAPATYKERAVLLYFLALTLLAVAFGLLTIVLSTLLG